MVEYQALDRVFHAISDRTRREIIAALAKQPKTVTQLAQPFSTSLNAISKHIVVLERAGLVHRKIEGRVHWLSLVPEPFEQAASWLDYYRRFWTVRLDSLEQHVLAKKAENESSKLTKVQKRRRSSD